MHDKQISDTNRENARKRWEKEKGGSGECDRIQSNATECDRTTYTNTITGTNSPTTTISSTVIDTEQDKTVFDSVDRQAASAAAKAEPPAGNLFSIKQLQAIATKNKVNLTREGIEEFYNQMQDDGWMLYGRAVDILRTLRAYAKQHPEYAPESEVETILQKKQEQSEPEIPREPEISNEEYERWVQKNYGGK
ncbi:hypothetical protein K413DRAFT_4848 [Clostridium sp. ASBs410]|nr:hypothetical protein K413DRAFT_4848 [Clostridium sp. ASBs410]